MVYYPERHPCWRGLIQMRSLPGSKVYQVWKTGNNKPYFLHLYLCSTGLAMYWYATCSSPSCCVHLQRDSATLPEVCMSSTLWNPFKLSPLDVLVSMDGKESTDLRAQRIQLNRGDVASSQNGQRMDSSTRNSAKETTNQLQQISTSNWGFRLQWAYLLFHRCGVGQEHQ